MPITLLIDDSCPLVHVYRYHRVDVNHKPPETEDGRRLLDVIPNEFLDRFCDVVEEEGIAGKFSVVPAPAGLGDVVRGIQGHDPALAREWLETVKRRLSSRFDFSPEMINHNLAENLENGGYFALGESDWSQTQTRKTLIPYLTRALQLLRDAGIDANGITSPWVFGEKVEEEYVASIAAAQQAVYGRRFSWYFLHALTKQPETRPWVALQEGDNTVVSIPATVNDFWWQTINSPRRDRGYIQELADRFLTEDGRSGAIRTVLDAGGWPVLVTHWQSLFSNGLETGLASLAEVGRRIRSSLAGEVEWVTCMEMARRTAD